jgi:hypothetical protein
MFATGGQFPRIRSIRKLQSPNSLQDKDLAYPTTEPQPSPKGEGSPLDGISHENLKVTLRVTLSEEGIY